MRQGLLVTPEMRPVPDTLKVIAEYKDVHVFFPAVEQSHPMDGDHKYGSTMILEGDQDEFVKWLKPFDAVAVLNGSPQFESFSIMHIREEL